MEVRYTPAAGNIVRDVLSRCAYPANTAAPDSSIHGSENDAAAWERTEVKVREQENQALHEHPLFADCMQELERGSKSLHLLSQNDGRQKCNKSGHWGLSEAFWRIYTRPLQPSRS